MADVGGEFSQAFLIYLPFSVYLQVYLTNYESPVTT